MQDSDWLTNDKDLRDKISAIENFSAKNKMSESKHMLAADSDESYAKQTLGIGSRLNSGHEKVLRNLLTLLASQSTR